MKYRKKPIVIEAVQWHKGDKLSFEGTRGTRIIKMPRSEYNDNDQDADFTLRTLEGDHKLTDGDYIIKGVKGELYPCKPDIFEMTYEKVEK